jgi:hypothetical protein
MGIMKLKLVQASHTEFQQHLSNCLWKSPLMALRKPQFAMGQCGHKTELSNFSSMCVEQCIKYMEKFFYVLI